MQSRRRDAGYVAFGTFTLVALFCMPRAQAQPQGSAQNAPAEVYRTFHVVNLTGRSEFQDVQTDLRNMLGGAHIFAVPEGGAISMRGTPAQIALAQQILSEIDRPQRSYRLTYTLSEMDGSRRIGVQHYAFIDAVGEETSLKEGSRLPVATQMANAPASSQIEYLDVGLTFDARLAGTAAGVNLSTKVVQSSIADDKANASMENDPVIRQTTLEGTVLLESGRPLTIGSLDIPGSTRHLNIDVVAEPIP